MGVFGVAQFRSWRNPNRVMLKDVVPLDTPYNLQIEPSSVCNARCVFCYHSTNTGGTLLSTETFRKIISDAKGFPSKIKIVDLYSSGEPLCNPHFADMVNEVKQAGISERVGVTTNGLLLTPKRIDDIITAGLDVIRISVNGLNSETYKQICGIDVNFDKFMETLSYPYANKGKCQINIKIADLALRGENEETFKDMFGNIADTIFVERIMPYYKDVDYDALDQDIQKRAIDGRYGMKQTNFHKVCYRPFIKFQIATSGNITASCCGCPVSDVIFGNVYKDNLVDVWNSSNRKAFLRMQLEGKRFLHPVCKDCLIPNDIAHETEILDPYADEILQRF